MNVLEAQWPMERRQLVDDKTCFYYSFQSILQKNQSKIKIQQMIQGSIEKMNKPEDSFSMLS